MNQIKIKLNIDNIEVTGFEGQTILDIAKKNNINIPTLCHDGNVETYGSCGLCVVEIGGSPKLFRACSTLASDGMIVKTKTERIKKNRKTNLELLISDHTGDCRAPCSVACPAETDCQGYVGLIAKGDFSGARKRIMEKIPFPATIGRVCPRPCEDACRRTLIEEPIAIAGLKQVIGDITHHAGSGTPQPKQTTGKSVAVIGGGPGGLAAAYYLRLKGHSVTVYDAMPHMGGMLRYGIPEYRLPKSILQKEIDVVSDIGVEFRNNVKIETAEFDNIRNEHDVVIVAIGAWHSAELRCRGEELNGVIGGIDYLRCAEDVTPCANKKVAVVGGGNTAMDACRTAVRMGAKKVYCVYRRTRDEMPAQDCEIREAEEEGVIFKFLTNPIEIQGQDKVESVLLQVMELSQPDSSGRCAPVPVEGKTECLEVDTVIVAIGQKPDLNGFDLLEKTKWGTISADERTFLTNTEKVFAIGDATNKGAELAVSAIGEAGRCAKAVDKFLNGKALSEPVLYLVKDEKSADDFRETESLPRVKVQHRNPCERAKDWEEVYTIFGEETAKKEAARCLECGCSAYRENNCKLIEYANRYAVHPEKYAGEINRISIPNDDHPEIIRNPEKCILCGLCVRVCDQVEKVTALGFAGRGFNTTVKPALDKRLEDTSCNSCGKCEKICPTGAFVKRMR
ncbi:MAG: FAD-dependent oxidoreductase [Oscillospiraceae bacterium]|nr:FAD-dependent oxidoreductase [Oscillospiraceae bacterium]